MAEHTGVAILLMLSPDDAKRIAIDTGEAPEQMHVTVGYLAQPAADYTDADRQRLTDALTPLADGLPIEATPFATAHFNPDDDERDPCAVILVQSDDLAALHDAVTDALGDDASTTFPIWIPHVTVAYNADPTVIPDGATTKPFTFDRLVLSWGGEQIDLSAESTTESFLRGFAWATRNHPAPFTERTRIALQAAIEAQGTSSPTLQLGQLEGVWAVIYARREAIEKLHGQALQDTLDAIARLDWGPILDGIERQLRLDPTLTGTQIRAELGQQVEDLITSTLPANDRAAWNAAMTAALTDATAEGQAAAVSLLADQMGVTIDWDLAASDAKAALAGSNILADDAGTWIGKQVHGLGYQISQRLATLWNDGATRAEMEGAIQAILGDASTSQAGLLLDTAIGRALSTGAMATYSAADIQFADFVTAGDARVCPMCDDAEELSPYGLLDCPLPPLHPGCRCTTAPSDQIASSSAVALINQYLDTSGFGLDLDN